jgi:hypothetical protein
VQDFLPQKKLGLNKPLVSENILNLICSHSKKFQLIFIPQIFSITIFGLCFEVYI